GNLDVHPAEDDAGDGRPSPGEDDALHAGGVHVYVPEPARRAGAVLDALQCAADSPAEVYGAHRQEAGEAAGASAQESLIVHARLGRSRVSLLACPDPLPISFVSCWRRSAH